MDWRSVQHTCTRLKVLLSGLGVMEHTLNPNTGSQKDQCEFENIIFYIASFRPARKHNETVNKGGKLPVFWIFIQRNFQRVFNIFPSVHHFLSSYIHLAFKLFKNFYFHDHWTIILPFHAWFSEWRLNVHYKELWSCVLFSDRESHGSVVGVDWSWGSVLNVLTLDLALGYTSPS